METILQILLVGLRQSLGLAGLATALVVSPEFPSLVVEIFGHLAQQQIKQ